MSFRQSKYEYSKPISNCFRTMQQNKLFLKKPKKYPKMIGEKTGIGNTCGMVSYTLLQK